MPKHTIEFNLPEEESELNDALNGGDLKSAIFYYDQALRSKIKFGNLPKKELVIWEANRDLLEEHLNEHDVSLEG